MRVTFYCNGHNYLAYKLKKQKIDYRLEDNAFTSISDYQEAQRLSDDIRGEKIHQYLDKIIKKYIPFLQETSQYYRWSIIQAEYSTDIIFKDQKDLLNIYDQISRNLIQSVKPENIATFFERKLAAGYAGKVGSNYNKMIQGIRIKHHMDANSIKIYHKLPCLLRIETTINNIQEIKLIRDVDKRDGTSEKKKASMKKSIYSLYELAKFCKSSNSRYLNFLSAFDDTSFGRGQLSKLSEKVFYNDRSYRGFNFFDKRDLNILIALSSGEFNIYGFRNKSLRRKLSGLFSPSEISRIIKRLILFGILKKIRKSYKYYLTNVGKKIIAAGLTTRELNIIPALAAA